jgi:hypothetical protein
MLLMIHVLSTSQSSKCIIVCLETVGNVLELFANILIVHHVKVFIFNPKYLTFSIVESCNNSSFDHPCVNAVDFQSSKL